MNCKVCNNSCVKNGFQKSGTQRFYCKICNRHQQDTYSYNAYKPNITLSIYKLVVNGCGINDIVRILNICKNTVKTRVLKMSKQLKQPQFMERFQIYEIDEMYAKVNGKQCWLTYAINRKTKEVIDFIVGRKTIENIEKVVHTILLLHPKKIYSDKLPLYKRIIPKNIHGCKRYYTNRIERNNLNLRTHLKRLQRKTICYSKNIAMLSAILKLYFWGSINAIELINI